MGMAAIFVIWPRLFEQIFILSTHKSSKSILALMGLAASQQKMFEGINPSDPRPRSNNEPDLWHSYAFM